MISSKISICGLHAVVVAAIVVPCLACGYLGWPGLHWDGGFYSSAILNAANSGVWELAGESLVFEWQGDLLLLNHGVLSVLLYGELLQCCDWQSLLGMFAATTALSGAAWYFAFIQLFGGYCGRKCDIALAGIAGCTAAALSMSLQGRPEQPALLLSALPFLFVYRAGWRHHLMYGVLIALLFTASPTCGLTAFAGCMWFLSTKTDTSIWQLTFRGLSVAAVAIFGVLAVLCLVPGGPIEWIRRFIDRTDPDKLTSSTGMLFSFIEPGKEADHFAPEFRPTVFFGVSGWLPFWNLMVVFLLTWCLGALISARRLLHALLLMAALLRLERSFVDYSYVVALLPGCWFVLRDLRRYDSNNAGLRRGGASIVCLFLIVNGCYLWINAAEAVLYRGAATEMKQLQELISSVCTADRSESGTKPAAGFVYSADQDLRILGPPSRRYVRLYSDVDDWRFENWRLSESTKKFLASEDMQVDLVVFPRSETDLNVIRIDGQEFRRVMRTRGAGKRIARLGMRDGVVGYAVDVFVRSATGHQAPD